MKIKGFLIRVLPYVGIFLLAWLITSIVINREDGLEGYNMESSSFPVLILEKDNEKDETVEISGEKD